MAELLVDSDSASVVSTDMCSPSTSSGGELNVSFSDLVCLEDSQEDGDTSKVCVSSASVERLFSKAGVILNQRRNRIDSGKLEKLVFIK